MKILHVVANCGLETGGGVAERTLRLSRALTARGAGSTVLTLDIGLDAARRRDWAHVTLRALPSISQRFFIPAARPGAIASVVADADIVDLTSHWTLLNALVYRAARRQSVPYVVHPAGALGIVGRSRRLKAAYNLAIGHRIVRDAAGHIAVTVGEAPAYAAYGIGPDQLTVIPNGVEVSDLPAVDLDDFRARHRLRGRRIILCVGRLTHIKGPDLLLEAFGHVSKTFPDYALVFAGPDVGMLDQLQRVTVELGITESVRFLGHIDGLEREAAFQACDFLALPSRREAMSLVALEAGIRGKPVLLTDQCGFDDAAVAGGGVLATATVAGLRRGLRTMIGRQEQLPAMGLALQALIRDRYTWDAAAARFLALCDLAVTSAQRPDSLQ